MKKYLPYLLAALAVLLAWRIVVVGLTDYYIDRIRAGDTNAIAKALFWDDDHPVALYYKAAQIHEKDPATATELLRASIRGNPTDSRPLALLARIRADDGDVETADRMMELALQLTPVDAETRVNAARYWYRRGELDRAVNDIALALESDGDLKDELFPVFFEIAENPAARSSLETLALEPPSWWDGFFSELIRRARDTESVRALFRYRMASKQYPVTRKERDEFISRLRRDGFITEAYLAWIDGLDEDQLHHLGNLFNGNFELEFSNSGFGWHAGNLRRTGIVLNTARTYGIDGEAALHVSFDGKRQRFSHLYQPLRLDPGKYRLTGKVRIDKLKSSGGLQWKVRCITGDQKVELGASERFLGSSEWMDFSIDFSVPDGCRGQELRLVSTGRRNADHEIKGEIWFDSMSISLVRDRK